MTERCLNVADCSMLNIAHCSTIQLNCRARLSLADPGPRIHPPQSTTHSHHVNVNFTYFSQIITGLKDRQMSTHAAAQCPEHTHVLGAHARASHCTQRHMCQGLFTSKRSVARL
jgi:hypothetical protein